jgi:ubiquinone/menaquinone biosynthesis C-methylase UbiE
LEQAHKRVDVTGLEISEVGVELSRRRVPDVIVLLKSVEAKVGHELYDYICSIGSLEHIIDISAALDRICGLLKPDGRWYFVVPNETWTHNDQPNERTATNAEWAALFAKHGLATLKIEPWNNQTAFMGCKAPAYKLTVLDNVAIIRSVQPVLGDNLLLNIGSGQRPFAKPWINIDCQHKWNPDVLTDANSMPMFEDAGAEMIVLQHVLEHQRCGECAGLLRECYRILQPGGRLFIFVPDVRALAQRWLMRQIDDYIFFVGVYGAYMGDEADIHKWNFSFDGLAGLLKDIGYKTVSRIGPMSLSNWDVSFDWWIMSVEAIK